MSIMFTVIQQIGVIGTFAMEWPEPLATVLAVIQLLNFNIEVLKMNCVANVGPFGRFATKVMIIFIGCTIILIIHVISVLVFYKGQFRRKMPSLMGAVGTIFMVFYISLVSTILGPLQCLGNPNGLWTSRPYQAVECWTNDGAHTGMVVLGLFACILPIGFFVHCSLAVIRFPKEMRDGNVTFLLSYAYLFFRYRVEVYWYSLAHMLRSLAIALSPVFPIVIIQILLVQAVTVVTLVMTVMLRPWRVDNANTMESLFSVGVILLLTMGSFFVSLVSTDHLSWFCVVLLFAMLVTMPVMLLYGVLLGVLSKNRKPFQFFICHHKAGAGCFARLLKCVLQQHSRVSKKCFIDCDDLVSLDKLFDYVGTQSDNCLAVLSKEIYLRQWCMGELVTAQLNKTPMIRLIMKGFVNPDEAFINGYAGKVDISGLTKHGVSVDLIQNMLRWIPDQPECQAPEKLNETTLYQLIDMLAKGQKQGNFSNINEVVDPEKPAAKNGMVIDHSNYEAIASALVLKTMLIKHTSHSPDCIPYVLPEGLQKCPKNVQVILFMCTNGALQQSGFIRTLICVAQHKARYLPILADESFRFPTTEFLTENKEMLNGITDKHQELDELIAKVFMQIAIVFQPEHYSSTENLLLLKASQVAMRIDEKTGAKELYTLYFPEGDLVPCKTPSIKEDQQDYEQGSKQDSERICVWKEGNVCFF
jgi:hypothetical protein